MLVIDLINMLKELGADDMPIMLDYFGKKAEIGAVYIDKDPALPIVMLSSMEFGSESHVD